MPQHFTTVERLAQMAHLCSVQCYLAEAAINDNPKPIMTQNECFQRLMANPRRQAMVAKHLSILGFDVYVAKIRLPWDR